MMKRLISASAIVFVFGCSGSDFSGGNKQSTSKGKSNSVENKAKPTDGPDAKNTNDPSDKTPVDPNSDKMVKAKQEKLSLGFVQNDKVYVPISKTVTIPVAVGGCKSTKDDVATCGPDAKSIIGVKVGEIPATVQTAKGPMNITVVVYDPKNPSNAVISDATNAAQAQINQTTDTTDSAQTTPTLDVNDDSASKPGTPDGPASVTDDSINGGNAYGGVFRNRVAFNDGFPNPYTNALNCPDGYKDQLVHEMTDQSRRFYCNQGSSAPCAIAIHACYKFETAIDNTAGFFRTSQNGPTIPNPYTGALSCPAGYNVVGLMEFYSKAGEFFSDGVNDGLVEVKYCVRATLGSNGRSGAFYRKDTKDGGERCVSPNPFTNACSCPAGFQTQNFHEFTAPGYYDGWSVGLYACHKG